LAAAVACGAFLSAGFPAAAADRDQRPPIVIEAGPPILRINIRLRSMANVASEQQFEQALADTPARRDAAERMRAALAGELALYQARPLRGQERIDFLETAARSGDAAAAAAIGEMFDVGDGVGEDAERAAGYYRAGAIGGRMDAAHNLGAAYAKGRGVPLDFTEGLAWLIVAHRRGDPGNGEEQLRQHLETRGKSAVITSAEQRANELDRKAAPTEVAAALPPIEPITFDATRTIAPGDDTNRIEPEPTDDPNDPPVVVTTVLGKSRQWPSFAALQRVANRGDPAAMGALGRLLTNGKRGNRDPLAAVLWLERSAAAGDADAAQQLGDLYSKRDGIVPDDAKALGYYVQAARAGVPLAMASVGVFHTNGRGTDRNLAEGLAWLIAAKHFGVDLGQEARVRAFLTQHQPAELPKAEQRANALLQELGKPGQR
jgi:TPR repeat protein